MEDEVQKSDEGNAVSEDISSDVSAEVVQTEVMNRSDSNKSSSDSWALYKRTGEGGIFEHTGEKLEPLTFSNGKTQGTIVSEVLDAIHEGNKIIFVHGVCGSGKSAIALNLAKHFTRSSIVVPIKSLQDQYEKDYMGEKFIMKDNNKPLNISILKGRNNFPCKFDAGERADNKTLPCTIELREKNTRELLQYIGQNDFTNVEDFSTASDIRRMNVAPACPYWSPVMPADMNPKGLGDYEKKVYKTVSGKDYAIFKREKGCPYYEQYESYLSSDVLIFNATKYLIESTIGRKPKTDIEIIDECDEFLDSFANEKKISVNRLVSALSNLQPKDQEKKTAVKDLIHKLNMYLFEKSYDVECEKVATTPFMDVVEHILKNPNLAEDEEFNYYNNAVEVVRSFEHILKDTYLSIDRFKRDGDQETLFGVGGSGGRNADEEQVSVTLVSINLAEKFKELLEMNKTFVMMSGTLHSAEVLKDIFGLEKFKVIEAEIESPGDITRKRTGIEKNCSYANFKSGGITRTQYLKMLDNCVAQSQKPTLVHVNAFSDLPTEAEQKTLMLENVITQEKLRSEQQNAQDQIYRFLTKQKDVLFTTKCARGVDFPGNKCNSIIMTRYPYPNISGLFWKILKKEQPDKFMEFYMDKARRELVQKVARGVRFKGDSVNLLSPDIRVLNTKLE